MGLLSLLLGPPRLAADPGTPGPLDDFWYGAGPGRRTLAGTDVDENRAMNYSACWAATRLLAGTGAGLPLGIYRHGQAGAEILAQDHPAHDLLCHSPNPEMSAMLWRATMIGQQVNWGNCYSEIERDAYGRPLALWPIHASRVQLRRDGAGALVYLVRNNDGSQTPFGADAIFHVPSFMSDDGVTGKGVIRQARESIGHAIAMERHGAAFFGNGAAPGVVLEHPGKLTSTARDNLRREWNEVHQGPDRSHKVAVLTEGMKANKWMMPHNEAQFIESRQLGVEEIARWYGVPPHMIQHLLRATFNNIEHMGQEFVTYALSPWLRVWEQQTWLKLFRRDERTVYYAKHNYYELLRGDTQTRTEALLKQFMNGALTLDEWRKIEDRNPVPGADAPGQKHFVPQNVQTIQTALQRERQETEKGRQETEPAPAAAPAETPPEKANLQGGQITALTAVTDKLAGGEYPPETVKAQLLASFPEVDAALIAKMVDELARHAEEKAKEAAEAPAAEQEEQVEGTEPPAKEAPVKEPPEPTAARPAALAASGADDQPRDEQGRFAADGVTADRDREDEATDAADEKEDNATQEQRDKEDEDLAKAQDKEDKAVEKGRHQEDKEIDKGRRQEDRARERQHEREDARRDAQKDRERDKEYRKMDARQEREQKDAKTDEEKKTAADRHDKEFKEITERHQKEDDDDAKARAAERDEAEKPVRAKRGHEDAARQARRAAEDRDREHQRDQRRREREARRQAEDAEVMRRRQARDAAGRRRRQDEDQRRQHGQLAAPGTAALRAAALEPVADCLARWLTRESRDLATAVGRERNVLAWADGYYRDYGRRLAEALRRPLCPYAALAGGDPAALAPKLAESWVERSRRDLLAATEATAKEFPAAVEKTLAAWPARVAEALAALDGAAVSASDD